jgi:S-(hydroxymethyl)glutathione dehydrogenase/alcohol dehydrogenase
MMGTWGGDSVPDRDYGRYGRLLSTNRFPIKELLSRPYSLTNVNSALNDLEACRVGRPLIDMTL